MKTCILRLVSFVAIMEAETTSSGRCGTLVARLLRRRLFSGPSPLWSLAGSRRTRGLFAVLRVLRFLGAMTRKARAGIWCDIFIYYAEIQWAIVNRRFQQCGPWFARYVFIRLCNYCRGGRQYYS